MILQAAILKVLWDRAIEKFCEMKSVSCASLLCCDSSSCMMICAVKL